MVKVDELKEIEKQMQEVKEHEELMKRKRKRGR